VELNRDPEVLREAGRVVASVRAEMAKRIVGKDDIVRGILMGVIASGHVLLEGVPGLAKTLAVKTFAEISGLEVSRIQFTPDLLPADITGTLIYEQATGRFTPRRGPLFANVILADEVNRAPAKVQSALLEAMEEGQVTIGDSSLALPSPFFVLATQNPIEHEGTYPLPEAQLDRFLLKVLVGYPSEEEETEVVRRVAGRVTGGDRSSIPVSRVLGVEEIGLLRRAAEAVRVDEALVDYLVRVIRATRPAPEARTTPAPRAQAPSKDAALTRDLARWLEYGASPRASIHLFRCARIQALLEGRDYVLPEDVKAVAPEVLRHRLVLSYEAEAEGVTPDSVVARLLSGIALP
jgi:MoxR-like ATPase